jgi:hypothetical protein
MEKQSCKILFISLLAWSNRFRTLPLDNHLKSECKRSDTWSPYICSYRIVDKLNFTRFTTFSAASNSQCNSGLQWLDAEAPVWMTKLKLHVGSNLLYFSFNAFPVICQSCLYRCPSSLFKYYRSHFNMSLPVLVSESNSQCMSSSWMFSLKQYLSNTRTWVNFGTYFD